MSSRFFFFTSLLIYRTLSALPPNDQFPVLLWETEVRWDRDVSEMLDRCGDAVNDISLAVRAAGNYSLAVNTSVWKSVTKENVRLVRKQSMQVSEIPEINVFFLFLRSRNASAEARRLCDLARRSSFTAVKCAADF